MSRLLRALFRRSNLPDDEIVAYPSEDVPSSEKLALGKGIRKSRNLGLQLLSEDEIPKDFKHWRGGKRK